MINRLTRGRSFTAVAVAGVAAITLAACSSGSSDEAAEPAADEAELTRCVNFALTYGVRPSDPAGLEHRFGPR